MPIGQCSTLPQGRFFQGLIVAGGMLCSVNRKLGTLIDEIPAILG
ncbi:hypothetical protein RB2150_05158 [Rhodobacterales bacterium HTCC2150]|nr:hypothetical protein RB2150_05158 [Rhodobacterales bacterium HTCC2150] [Rhodobacteraceae bacterium HTCC2150]